MECADADKYDHIYCNALTVINKIVFTSPEAMVEFSGKKNITSALVKTFANIYSFERSILLRATGKQKSPITNHAMQRMRNKISSNPGTKLTLNHAISIVSNG